MFYYCSFEYGHRYVVAYDETKHGVPRRTGNRVFLAHGAISVPAVYTSCTEALSSYGKYSTRPVFMPDGSKIVPAKYFGHCKELVKDVFIPWSCVRGEKWPGEV